MSDVEDLTEAFLRGEVTADQVIARVEDKPPPPPKSYEQEADEWQNDYVDRSYEENTWSEILEDAMPPEKFAELDAAYVRRFGRDDEGPV